MPPKINKILGFYTHGGIQVTADQNYEYAQIELLGGHARDVKQKSSKTPKTFSSQETKSDQEEAEPDPNLIVDNDADGYIMLVSKQDLNLVMNYKWYLNSNGYPGTYGSIHKDEENWGAPYPLHRFLFVGIPEGYVVDHINRNRLDNRRQNLRIITAKQNSFNRKKPKNSKNKYKGVRKMGGGKFKAVISKDGKTYTIKDCETEKAAALAYDAMAEELFGQYAGKNFPN
jgi:HNH endonuclease